MHEEVKKYAQNGDIKGLRYVFVDCLDVDPTFEKYREDYEYCKKVPGLFETYEQLNPLVTNKEEWNRQYWETIKLDLTKNFSEKRFEHMIAVAQVVYADKIARLTAERKTKEQSEKKAADKRTEQSAPMRVQTEVKTSNISSVEAENRRIEESRRKLALENQKVEEEQRRQRERIEARKAELARENAETGDQGSKKAIGIVLAAAAVVLVILLILVFA